MIPENQSGKVFTAENLNELRTTCQSIDRLCDDHIEGDLMWSQMMILGDQIGAFISNPIVARSGIIPSKSRL